MSNETAWLIEIQIGGRAVWWRAIANCGRTWTTDANEAVRFARKGDAERVIRGLRGDDPVMAGAIATEHMWCAAPAEALPADAFDETMVTGRGG
jgi:hypothetical protein